MMNLSPEMPKKYIYSINIYSDSKNGGFVILIECNTEQMG